MALTVISDIDDTLMLSDVLHPVEMPRRALLSEAFTGMATLLNSVKAGQTIYLSARPELLRKNALHFLSLRLFPKGTLITRDESNRDSVYNFKLNHLRELLPTLHDSVILIGDDTESDPEVFAQIQTEFPMFVAGAYIHQIQRREIPPSNHGYVLAYDLAEMWEKKNFLAEADVQRVKKEILEEPDLGKIIPKFQKCPGVGQIGDVEVLGKLRGVCPQGSARIVNR